MGETSTPMGDRHPAGAHDLDKADSSALWSLKGRKLKHSSCLEIHKVLAESFSTI